MTQNSYFELLVATVPGYQGYESNDATIATDTLVKDLCLTNLKKIKINLEQCRGCLISSIGADQSELKFLSSLIASSKEPLEIMTDEESLSALGYPELKGTTSKIYELDRNLIELSSQLLKLSEDLLSSLMAADDLNLAESELFLQRGLNHFKELWSERAVILKILTI